MNLSHTLEGKKPKPTNNDTVTRKHNVLSQKSVYNNRGVSQLVSWKSPGTI